jgi:hypothetical protein
MIGFWPTTVLKTHHFRHKILQLMTHALRKNAFLSDNAPENECISQEKLNLTSVFYKNTKQSTKGVEN